VVVFAAMANTTDDLALITAIGKSS
jgi:hypothetical protein